MKFPPVKAKTITCLKIVRMLLAGSGIGGGMAVHVMADRFNVSTGTIERYLATIREAGFKVVKIGKGVYKI